MNKGCAARLAFAALIFGELSEALFWLQLPRALYHLINQSLNKSSQKTPVPEENTPQVDEAALLTKITSGGRSLPGFDRRESLVSPALLSSEFSVHF